MRGISEITVKAHRGNVMRKMKADCFAHLVNMASRLRVGRYLTTCAVLYSANAWMMREYADVIDLTGNHLEANDLRREADEMVKAVMTLYEPGKGVWASMHRNVHWSR